MGPDFDCGGVFASQVVGMTAEFIQLTMIDIVLSLCVCVVR